MPDSGLLRSLAKVIVFLPMVLPLRVLGQEDQRGTPPADPAHQQAGQSGEHSRHDSGVPRAYGDGQNVEGTAVTQDHAMRTEIPEPARDNAFSMTVSQYGITATLQTLASEAGSAIMERGGNVVDAIIAANAAVGVIEPSMNGVGGDLSHFTGTTRRRNFMRSTPAGGLRAAGRSKISKRITSPGSTASGQ